MGIPGDHIHLENGVVYRNGVALKEPYVKEPPDQPGFLGYRDDFPDVPPEPDEDVTAEWAEALPQHIQNGDLVVPPGMYFCMGDNRSVSLGSRYWGFVPRANIVGRPLFNYWSFKSSEADYDQPGFGARLAWMAQVVLRIISDTRWSRTFHVIH